jgi:S-formylglutathione hydrolase FrmB
MFKWTGMKKSLDLAIRNKIIQPVILVMPNSNTRFGGSFYSNSTLTGNWADYIAIDVVNYIDKNFRTIAKKESRGLSGHSMGGTGTLKIAMLFPDLFGAVYAMSPGALHFSNEFSPDHPAFKRISKAKNENEIFKGFDDFENFDPNAFFTVLLTSLSRTYSPDPNKTFQADLPVTYINDSMVVHSEVIKKWEASFPVNMIKDHVKDLKSFRAFKIDWGRDDEFSHIPVTSREFSKKLQEFKIPHFAEEYLGDHVNKLDGPEGRIYTDLLPFFASYLTWQIL